MTDSKDNIILEEGGIRCVPFKKEHADAAAQCINDAFAVDRFFKYPEYYDRASVPGTIQLPCL